MSHYEKVIEDHYNNLTDYYRLNAQKASDQKKEPEKKCDSVNHPKHYNSYKGVEVIQLTEQMNFNRGNAVKYITRAGLKDKSKELEDLEKALWYINREINRLKND